MTIKNCEECAKGFESSRKTQRFCSKRCANRQRDRRRRTRSPAQLPKAHSLATDLKAQLEATKRELESKARSCQRHREVLQSKLRSQASEIDRLEAENSEQRVSNNLLQSEVSRLKRAQRTNVQDLAHISAWLVSLAQAKGVALDQATLEIFRRRGWHPSKRQAGAPRL
ncbi:hypothetical protein [Arthrobacter bambusae]|uniref:Chromosome segregation ATPase n=1 Tax=Arthrobacter bambusae TaxID=1338426 RepID=A0AAW8DAX0_9MICC|nr:hypothetical protein [Arthrobacter bambusae]MDP9906056.1 chromosome segregation ATPase [Arthrobacter bambusae]MDQ0131149.1 chromosome segregation ATPase [Arthrobacter bambusae]MDQ0181859.1 chromosome segregation ATPase [Arthrobacter bambusae]